MYRKDRIFAVMYMPGDSPFLGSKPISEISEFRLQIAPDDDYAQMLAHGMVPIGFKPDGKGLFCFVKNENGEFCIHEEDSLLGFVGIPSTDPDYILLLIGRGWKFKQEFLDVFAPNIDLDELEPYRTELVA